MQLRGEAGDRQVPYDAKTAVALMLGGMYMNAVGMVFRTN